MIVKSLIGSIVGAAVALGIYYGIKQSTGETYVWFPLIIGLIVGIATRMAAGSSISGGSRVVAGALAAIVAICAALRRRGHQLHDRAYFLTR